MLEANPNLETSEAICRGVEMMPAPCHVQEKKGKPFFFYYRNTLDSQCFMLFSYAFNSKMFNSLTKI